MMSVRKGSSRKRHELKPPVDANWNETLCVLDCNYLGHTVKHTMKGFSHESRDTGIIYGFLRRVLSLSKKLKTRNLVFCWDSKVSFRKKRFPFYKNQPGREYTEEDRPAFRQFDELREDVLPRIGFQNVLCQRGLEADDLIAEICCTALCPVVVVTADHDLFQVLRKDVSVFNPSAGKYMTKKSFENEFGISSAQWAKVKAIAGCTSDNVPGVKRVGEKTAIKYLKKELKPDSAAQKSIDESEKLIRRNMLMVKLPLPLVEPISIRPDEFSREELARVAVEYNMRSIEEELDQWQGVFSSRKQHRIPMNRRT